MVGRNVIWTRTADIQFVGILEYWATRNKSNTYSKKLLKLVGDMTSQIAKTPFIYKSTDFQDTHVATLVHYSIYYHVNDEFITVTAFWDNRQDLGKLLKVLQSQK